MSEVDAMVDEMHRVSTRSVQTAYDMLVSRIVMDVCDIAGAKMMPADALKQFAAMHPNTWAQLEKMRTFTLERARELQKSLPDENGQG